MRFRKRADSVTTAEKLLFGKRPEPTDTALATEERSALLHAGPIAPEAPEIHDETFMGADPTQRLLTCLGRFQRQVAKAESGANQDAWCDECVNQIITGIEIALSQSWDNVREALTDTARVLQSYEEPGRAAECIPFLLDSYEILCLMVGDIIVDNTRSGVMRKWRERYEQALHDLARVGLRLVNDDDDSAQTYSSPARESALPSPRGEGQGDGALFALTHGSDAPESGFEDHFAEEDDDADAVAFSNEYDEASASAAVFADEAFQKLCAGAATAAAAYEEELHGDASTELNADPLEEEETPELEDDFEWSTPSASAPEPEVTFEEIAGEETAEMPEEMVEFSGHDEMPLGEHIDQGFTGDVVPASVAPAEMPVGESTDPELFEPVLPEDLVDDAGKAATTPAEVSPAAAEEADDIQALFRTVQNAVTRGDVAQAKLLALQLAASMARLEVERAEHTLEKARARLTEYDHATEAARSTVRQAEEDLAAVESRISETQNEFQAKRRQISELRERATAIEAGVEDLDAQILALQERRMVEIEQRDLVEERIEEALSEESRVQTDLEELAEAERLAGQLLEDHRAQVEKLLKEHDEQQGIIARAHAALDDRMGSASEIQRTLHQEDRQAGAVRVELSS